MMRKLAVVADYLDDSHRTHIEKMAGDAGFTVAAHLLGKCWRDGMGVLPDDEQAELWFRRAAEAGGDR